MMSFNQKKCLSLITTFVLISPCLVFAAATNYITASAGPNGSIVPSGAVAVTNGGSTNFTITASNGYHIASIKTNSADIAGSPYTNNSFTSTNYVWSNITTDGTIAATFAINTYTITSSAGANGSISPSGAVVVNYNGSTNFVITAISYHRIASIKTNGADIAGSPYSDNSFTSTNYVWSNIIADGTIAATFAVNTNTYTITASAGANGSITPSGAVVVNYYGTNFTITAAANYHIASITTNSVNIPGSPYTNNSFTSTNYVYTNVIANGTIAATFAINTYTITSSAGANGSISPSGAVVVDYNGSTNFTITANTYYHIASITTNSVNIPGSPYTNNSFTSTNYVWNNIIANGTIAATFAVNTYTKTTNSIPYAESFEGYANGTHLTVGPNAWYGAEDAITVTTNIIYNYPNSYTNACGLPLRDATHTNVLTLTDSVTNKLSGNTNENIWVDFVLNPVYWDGTNAPTVSNDVQMACYINSNANLVLRHATNIMAPVAIWNQLTNTFLSTAAWTRVSINMDYATKDTDRNLKYYQVRLNGILQTNALAYLNNATPLSAGLGGSWFCVASANEPSKMQSFAVSGTGYLDDLVVTNGLPPFPPYTITASKTGNGTITPSGAVIVTNHGGSTNFVITASNNYHIASIKTNGADIAGSPYTGNSFTSTNYVWSNITDDGTIAATFAINTYTITSSAGANGSITPSGAVVVNYNGSTNFTITASNNYHIASIQTNGAHIAGSPYTGNSFTSTNYVWSNITTDGTIAAAFAINTFTITPSAGANGSISPSSPVIVNYGTSTNFTIAASNNYHIASIQTNGAHIAGSPYSGNSFTSTNYVWSNITTDGTIAATFGINTYTLTATTPYGTAVPAGVTTNDWNASISASVAGSPVTNGVSTQYVCTGWTGTGSASPLGATTNTSFNITNTSTITWNWKTQYLFTASAGPNGYVTSTNGFYDKGSNATATAVASNNYQFVGWTGAVQGDTNNSVMTVSMDQSRTIIANFAAAFTSNGTPYSWLAAYGITNNQETAVNADPDGDSLLTWQEYITGTDPTNALSVFKIIDQGYVAGSNYVIWYGTSNGVALPFGMQRSTNLIVGFGLLPTNITRNVSGTNVWWDTTPPAGVPVFYRPVATNVVQ